jgi:hypothetical protein
LLLLSSALFFAVGVVFTTIQSVVGVQGDVVEGQIGTIALLTIATTDRWPPNAQPPAAFDLAPMFDSL